MNTLLIFQTFLVILVLIFRWTTHEESALRTVLQLGIIAALKHRRVILFLQWRIQPIFLAIPAITFFGTAIILGVVSWVSGWPSYLTSDGNDLDAGKQLQPLLFPCRTSHTRLYPRVHSFSYSYLYAGVPVGWKGRTGTLLSAENTSSRTRFNSWFSVEAEDHLARGTHVDGLAGKLRDYLKSQNVSHRNCTHAYLITAPRFLGYSFNPVSYWYLYDDKNRLSAMILEVNNTFDERRPYLLVRDSASQDEHSAPGPIASFSQTWLKDFHVSPFNDRQGFYSLKAADPFAAKSTANIDNNITLSSADGKPKLVARVFSSSEPVHPNFLSSIDTLRFLCAWWWVGLTTDLRILREARKLWVKGLQVFYRPEVLVSTIGRRAAAEEEIIEQVFRTWLKRAVDSSPRRLVVQYEAALNIESTECFQSSSKSVNVDTVLRVRILSPAFYRALVYASSVVDAFDETYFKAADSAKLISVSDDAKLKDVLLHSPPFQLVPGRTCMPGLPLQLFQHYVMFSIGRRVSVPSPYITAALKIWLADRVSFGNLTMLNLCLKALWLCWLYFSLGVIEEISVALSR